MAVNLGKNRLALLTAYQDVIDETSDTDWWVLLPAMHPPPKIPLCPSSPPRLSRCSSLAVPPPRGFCCPAWCTLRMRRAAQGRTVQHLPHHHTRIWGSTKSPQIQGRLLKCQHIHHSSARTEFIFSLCLIERITQLRKSESVVHEQQVLQSQSRTAGSNVRCRATLCNTGQITVQAERFVSSQFVLSGISPDQVFTRRQLEAISGFYVMRCSGVCVCASVFELYGAWSRDTDEPLHPQTRAGRREGRGREGWWWWWRMGGGRRRGGWASSSSSSPFVASRGSGAGN